MKKRDAAVLCLLMLTLSACGESDLNEINNLAYEDGLASSGVLASASPVVFDLTQYDLKFSDEFNGNSLDERKWGTAPVNPEVIIYNQLQYYVDALNPDETLDSPFSFDGDNLIISATMTPEGRESDANGQSYLSGLLTTRDRFDMAYGYVEARINVNQGRGVWPALWMLGTDTDKLRPEVYLLEYDGSKPDSVFHAYNFVDEAGNLRSPGQQEVTVNGFSDGFHTVGLRWTPEELLFFVDGQPSWRVIGQNVPNEDMYFILNLAIGGLWTGAPDGTTPDPVSLLVDYVRIYQLKE